MKTIFITGESGTIPMAIQKIAETTKEFKVINTQLENNFLSNLKKHQSFKVRVPELDFLDRSLFIDWSSLWKQVDLIIHSGAFVGTDYCSSDPNLAIRTNVEGTQNIVDICNKYNIPLIYMSTTAILDPNQYDQHIPMSEESQINPQTLYGITKYAGELIVKNTCKTKSLIVRPVFGFGNYPDDLHSALTKVIYVIYRNLKGIDTKLTVLLDYLIPKSYTRVENIANCILNFARKIDELKDKEIFNIGEHHLKSRDWVQLTSMICNSFQFRGIANPAEIELTLKDKITFVAEKDYLHYHNMNDYKIRQLGFDFERQPNYISLSKGIAMTVDSVIENITKEPYWL